MIHKCLAAALLALTAATVAQPSVAQELTLWSWRQEDRAAYDKIIGGFEAANPGINPVQAAAATRRPSRCLVRARFVAWSS